MFHQNVVILMNFTSQILCPSWWKSNNVSCICASVMHIFWGGYKWRHEIINFSEVNHDDGDVEYMFMLMIKNNKLYLCVRSN